MVPDPAGKRWLSVKETGALLGLSAKTIYLLCLKDELPHVRVGGSVRIDKTKLEADLERQVNGRSR